MTDAATYRLAFGALVTIQIATGCAGQGAPAGPQAIDATTLGERLAAELTPTIERTLAEEHVTGAAVVVVRDGRTLYKRGFGVQDIRTGMPVDADQTIFRIGSVSKPMTAWAIASLIDQGRMELDDPVSDYVPEIDGIPNISGSDEPVRIWHLLTHTGGFDQIGIGRQVPGFDRPAAERVRERRSLAEFLFDDNLRRTSAPGVHYRYDTYGITLAGLVLERATGKPFPAAMREALFEPAGMTNATVGLERLGDEWMAVGHGWIEDQQQHGIAPYEVYITLPASSVDLSGGDMESLMQAVTGGTGRDGATPFSDDMRQALMSPSFRPHSEFSGVTYGMNEITRVGGSDGGLVAGVGHGGSVLGFSTMLMFLPEHNTGIFVVVNRNGEAGGGRVSLPNRVISTVAGLLDPDAPEQYAVPELRDGVDLGEYAGRYAYGVFCKTCTEDELGSGAWQPFSFLDVEAAGPTIVARELVYRPTGERGVFVSENGRRKLCFLDDASGRPSTVSFISSPDTFERID
ncbi:MAG: serine hydrolase domain-containing protein [Planctomycetota bacterium]